LWQGSRKLFDSGYWETAGSARSYDYDRFIIEFGPNKPTTFQFKPMSAGTSASVFLDDGPGYPDNLVDDGNFDNKSYYLNQLLGSTTDENGLPPSHPDYKKTSGWESRDGQKYTTLRNVTTQDSNSNLTDLRLEVNSSTWFQVRGRYIPPEAESSAVGNKQDLQVSLHTSGLGLLRENDDANGFPIINIATLGDAQKAIDSITNEIGGLTQQLGNLSSNMTRVENSMDAAQKQVATHEQALSGVAREDLAMQMLSITKARIARSQSAALLTQAMNLNYDIVNMII
jgi:flagellin-like hook-associated protein FlgL